MNSHIDKAQLLGMIQSARAQWESLLAGIPEPWMTEPGVEGEWSIKDIIAHIARGERDCLGVTQARAIVGSDLWQLPEDERNAAMVAQNRDLGLREALTESRDVFQRYLAAVVALSEQNLNDLSRFSEMPDGWRPWRILCDPAHYQGYAESIRAWLERRQQTAS